MSDPLHYMGRRMRTVGSPVISRDDFEKIYAFYNSPRWIHPDPLEFVYHYSKLEDREVAGLVASSLAYGRVGQILKSADLVLEKMGPSPYGFLKSATFGSVKKAFGSFKHRFTTGEELVLMLMGAKRVIERYGSLYACFLAGFNEKDETVLPALIFLVRQLRSVSKGCHNSLLALPEKGSACKKLNLFLRWMVREDRVDPGGWREVSPSKLIVPLDTHMHRMSRALKLTTRKNADMRAAIEVTEAFRKINPEDPVRYDFALTRLGIRKDGEPTARGWNL